EFGPHPDPLAPGQALAREHRASLEQHLARPDPALQPGARVLRERGGQGHIEALAGGRQRQFELMNAELSRHGGVERRRRTLIRYTAPFASLGYPVTVRSGLRLPFTRSLARLAAIGGLGLCVALTGCASAKQKQFQRYTAQGLYHDARKALQDN